MSRWTRRRRRRGSSAGTGPPSTAASSRLWRECLRGHTTPTPLSERTSPAGSTSPRPESRYETGTRLLTVPGATRRKKKEKTICFSHVMFYSNDAINHIQRLLFWHSHRPDKITLFFPDSLKCEGFPPAAGIYQTGPTFDRRRRSDETHRTARSAQSCSSEGPVGILVSASYCEDTNIHTFL